MTTQRQAEIDKLSKEELTQLSIELGEKMIDVTEVEQVKLWPTYLYVKYKLQTFKEK